MYNIDQKRTHINTYGPHSTITKLFLDSRPAVSFTKTLFASFAFHSQISVTVVSKTHLGHITTSDGIEPCRYSNFFSNPIDWGYFDSYELALAVENIAAQIWSTSPPDLQNLVTRSVIYSAGFCSALSINFFLKPSLRSLNTRFLGGTRRLFLLACPSQLICRNAPISSVVFITDELIAWHSKSLVLSGLHYHECMRCNREACSLRSASRSTYTEQCWILYSIYLLRLWAHGSFSFCSWYSIFISDNCLHFSFFHRRRLVAVDA